MFLISFVQPSHRRSLLRLSAILFIFAAVFADHKLSESTEAAASSSAAAAAAASSAAAAPPPPQPGGLRNYNFDGDGAGRADIGRWRPANTEFRVFDNSGSFRIYTLGTSAAKAAPGDFNGVPANGRFVVHSEKLD